MNKNMDTKHYQKALEKELETLEAELKTVGHRNPRNPADWEADAKDVDSEAVEDLDVAEGIEEYESNTAILKPLETQYNDVKSALERIKKETYGKCEVCGKEIEKDRLEANPSARTCLAHISKK